MIALKKFFREVAIIIATAAICGGAVWAGSLTPSASPAATGYTLEDIYNRLNTNAEATAGNHSFSPSGSPAGSMYSLTQIYEKIPAIDGSKILAGTSYLGVSGTIADCVAEGGSGCYASNGYWTANAGGNITGGDGDLVFSIPEGFYSGKTCIAADANLISGNIKSGASIFGVAGDGNVVDTSSGDATAGDILSGKVAWAGGSEITGVTPAGDNVTGANGSLTITIPDGFYSGSKTATAQDSNLLPANIKSGTEIFGVAGSYSATYKWKKFSEGEWEGINENLDWIAQVGDTSWWASQTYSYCASAACTNNGSLQSAANYTGPPGGWNGSNDSTNFNNTALHNYAVIAANSTDLGDCIADKGDLAFPDGSVWDKSNAKPYSVKLAGCDSNDTNAAAIWAAADGSGSQYANARNAPSALAIADAWDGIKDLQSGPNDTNTFSNNYTNDDYYTLPNNSWYANGGTSRLPMIDEYERARKSVPGAGAGLLSGTSNLSSYNWSAEQSPSNSSNARSFNPNNGYAGSNDVSNRSYPLWVAARGE